MKPFFASFTDFIKFDRKPNEDFYLISDVFPLFILADGVSQAHFPSGGYAFPAGARAAAQILCYTALEFLENKLQAVKNNQGVKEEEIKKLIGESFDLVNSRIKDLNKNEGITDKLDYFVYDYFDTVGIVGFILQGVLYYGYVGDCGMAVFDKNNNLKFLTTNQVAPINNIIAPGQYPNWEEKTEAEKTKILHKEFRNNISGPGYGSFSGEEGVKHHYIIESLRPELGDLIIFYSDGFFPYFQFPEFLEIIRRKDNNALYELSIQKAREDFQKFGTDRTLIAIDYNPITI
ncbi:MAG: protein phosphatase 2C domain-containing protein [Candidatus Parcubacteria bacterium]|nr:protein phosphatase 2C domain-containing protein [Candidatus Parcubacteria bacterium]